VGAPVARDPRARLPAPASRRPVAGSDVESAVAGFPILAGALLVWFCQELVAQDNSLTGEFVCPGGSWYNTDRL